MKLNEFAVFVAKNQKYKFKDKELKNIADAVREILENNEVPTYQNIARILGYRASTVQHKIESFIPPKIKEENLEKVAVKISEQKEEQRKGTLTTKQVEASLGEAYSRGIKELSGHYGWFGEALMGIGRIALEGYLMNLDVAPEETESYLRQFENPKELIDGFKTFFIGLLKFRTGASEMETLIDELETDEATIEYAKQIIQRQKAMIAELQKINAMLTVAVPPKKLDQIMTAIALSNMSFTEEKKAEESKTEETTTE